jgi:hypothetical protein
MAWYKYEFHHGPGHQGTHIEYRWYEAPPGDDEEHETMHDIANAQYMNGWTCNCDPVEALPDDVRKELVEKYQGRIRGAKYMLKVLGVES